MPTYLGIRHLSPNGAYNIIQKLEQLKPKVVLIETPADFSDKIQEFSNKEIKPPFAMLAYTINKPIKTLLVPFCEYSPEYQAVLWCNKNKVTCKFIDLPSNISLAQQTKDTKEIAEQVDEENKQEIIEEITIDVYEKLDEKLGNHETFWESYIEHSNNDYFEMVNTFGEELRKTDVKPIKDIAENTLREAYMKMEIEKYASEENVVVICGSYHVDGLKNIKPMTQKELDLIKTCEIKQTLMPYSYFKLSNQSGYGAGNRAPEYYHMLWEAINKNKIQEVSHIYLSKIARIMREQGHNTSPALVLDAIILANSLASLNGRAFPTLCDLEDACMTCFGEGSKMPILNAQTLVQIGTKIGSLPQGVSNTSIQQDFQTYIKELKLEKYLAVVNQEIDLDLRENIHVKSTELAFLDLKRSFFFHKLEVLDVKFSKQISINQDSSTFKERFNLQWDTNVEIALIECSLLGETIEGAVIEKMTKELEENSSIEIISKNIKDSFLCGLPSALNSFVRILQSETIDSNDFMGFCKCIDNLSTIIMYKDLRKMDTSIIEEILKQIYLKAVLAMKDACFCTDDAIGTMMNCINILNKATIDYHMLDSKIFMEELDELSDNLDINQFLSGYATATLLERGQLTVEQAENKIAYHLSTGMDGFKSANWLEGFCMKNHYQLILNLNIWKLLDNYISQLEFEEFKPVLLFLRRAFATFSGGEKDSIVDNLQEIWGVSISNDEIIADITDIDLDGFDFDDL